MTVSKKLFLLADAYNFRAQVDKAGKPRDLKLAWVIIKSFRLT